MKCSILTEDSHDENEHEVDVLQDNEEVEVAVVVDSDAVVDPLAVMVKTFNALIADVAVARISCADDFTVGTK